MAGAGVRRMTYQRVSSSILGIELKLKEEVLDATLYKYSITQRDDVICACRERFKLLQSHPKTPQFRRNLRKENDNRIKEDAINEDSPIVS